MRGGSERRFTAGRFWPNQINRGGVECFREAAESWRPRLGAQGLQPDQGIAADAGAVGQLLLSQGGLEATAPEAAEGDHGRREWMVAGEVAMARQCIVDVIFMTISGRCACGRRLEA